MPELYYVTAINMGFDFWPASSIGYRTGKSEMHLNRCTDSVFFPSNGVFIVTTFRFERQKT